MSSGLGTEINYSEIFHGCSQSYQEDTNILGFSGHHVVSRVVVTILEGHNISFFKVDFIAMNPLRFFQVLCFITMPVLQNIWC
jgi:hypothetical protein